MHGFLKIMGLAAITAASPAVAQSVEAPEWWLVLDHGGSQSAHFIDLASMTRSAQGLEVRALIVDRSGNLETKLMNLDCSSLADNEPAVTNFVCGNEDYRNGNGLILGMVSPEEMAKMLFSAQSQIAPARTFQQA
jgi:hypothetical protein